MLVIVLMGRNMGETMGEKPVFRIGFLKTVDNLFMGLADPVRGREFDRFFLEPIALGSWNEVLAKLCDRNIDGAFIPVPAAIDLLKAGVDIKLLLKGPGSGAIFVKNAGAKIKKLTDFKGKTIFVPHGLSIYILLIHRLMASVGLKFASNVPADIRADVQADVFFEPIASNMMPEALSCDDGGWIGGFIAPEPFGTMAIKAGTGEMLCRAEKLWPGYPSSVFVLQGTFVKEFPHAVHKLVETLVKDIFAIPGMLHEKADLLINPKTLKLIAYSMEEVLGFVLGETDITGSLQMDFALKAGAIYKF